MGDNIVKKTCAELSITQKELAEAIGYKPDTINKAVSTGKVSEPLQKAIDLFMENAELKKQLQDYNQLRDMLKKAVS